MSKWSAGYRDSRYVLATKAAFDLSGGCCEACGCEVTEQNVRIIHIQERLAPWQHDESVMAAFCDECWKIRNAQHYKILVRLLQWQESEIEILADMIDRSDPFFDEGLNGILSRACESLKDLSTTDQIKQIQNAYCKGAREKGVHNV